MRCSFASRAFLRGRRPSPAVSVCCGRAGGVVSFVPACVGPRLLWSGFCLVLPAFRLDRLLYGLSSLLRLLYVVFASYSSLVWLVEWCNIGEKRSTGGEPSLLLLHVLACLFGGPTPFLCCALVVNSCGVDPLPGVLGTVLSPGFFPYSLWVERRLFCSQYSSRETCFYG